MQLSESLFTHMIMDNNIVRMSQEKMVNTTLSDTELNTRQLELPQRFGTNASAMAFMINCVLQMKMLSNLCITPQGINCDTVGN